MTAAVHSVRVIGYIYVLLIFHPTHSFYLHFFNQNACMHEQWNEIDHCAGFYHVRMFVHRMQVNGEGICGIVNGWIGGWTRVMIDPCTPFQSIYQSTLSLSESLMVNDCLGDGLIDAIKIDTTKSDSVVAILVAHRARSQRLFPLISEKKPNTFLQSFQGENDYYYHRRCDCVTYESRYKSSQWHSVPEMPLIYVAYQMCAVLLSLRHTQIVVVRLSYVGFGAVIVMLHASHHNHGFTFRSENSTNQIYTIYFSSVCGFISCWIKTFSFFLFVRCAAVFWGYCNPVIDIGWLLVYSMCRL